MHLTSRILLLALMVVTGILLGPVLLVLCILYKLYQTTKAKLTLRDDEMIMKNCDAMWFHDAPTNRCIIHSMTFLKGAIKLEDIRQRFLAVTSEQDNKMGFYKLRSTELLEDGVIRWRQIQDYDIKDNITRHPAKFSDMEEVQQFISARMQQAFPSDKSPWSVTLLELADDTSVLLFKFKHTVGDGIGLIRLFLEHLIDTPMRLGSNVQPRRSAPKPTFASTAVSAFKMLAHLPKSALEILKIPDANMFHGADLSGKVNVAWSKPIPLQKVKAIKDRQNATVNDVIVTAVCEGLARYSADKGSEPIKRDVTLFMPASVRNSSSSLKLENQIAIIPGQFPISHTMSLRERLSQVKHTCNTMKETSQPLTNVIIQNLMSSLLPSTIADFLFDNITSRGTAIVSNVPGPDEKAYMFGVEVSNLMFFVPSRADVGFGISILSYAKHVMFGIRVDSSISEEPGKMCDRFVESLHDMETL